MLRKHDYKAELSNFKVNNICGAISLNPIDLVSLKETYPAIASYERELFPVMKFKYDTKIYTIHHTGKIFSTGFKTIEQMNNSFEKLISIVQPFSNNL